MPIVMANRSILWTFVVVGIVSVLVAGCRRRDNYDDDEYERRRARRRELPPPPPPPPPRGRGDGPLPPESREACRGEVPNMDERPNPTTPVRVTGFYSCVLGGQAHGTGRMTLNEREGGRIAGAFEWMDGPREPFTGNIVGEDLHLFIGDHGGRTGTVNAGSLRIDRRGDALRGEGKSYRNGSCDVWTMSCSRVR